jgi:putative membrane protein
MGSFAVSLASATAALILASGVAQARTPDSTESSRAFVREVIQGDLAEIQVGKLAQEKGSKNIKEFGQRLASDHTANLKKARLLADSLGVAAPAAPTAKQKAMYDKLSSLSGHVFDRQFAKRMVQDHKKDIMAFQQESRRSGPTADFAKQTLSTLQAHLDLAKSLTGSKA